MSIMIPKANIERAYKRISAFSKKTPLVRSHVLSDLVSGEVFLKCENLQETGSFKVRGALNKILSMDSKELESGVITA